MDHDVYLSLRQQLLYVFSLIYSCQSLKMSPEVSSKANKIPSSGTSKLCSVCFLLFASEFDS